MALLVGTAFQQEVRLFQLLGHCQFCRHTRGPVSLGTAYNNHNFSPIDAFSGSGFPLLFLLCLL